jgi:ribosomal protein S18 acetylase RimI-like enzyme
VLAVREPRKDDHDWLLDVILSRWGLPVPSVSGVHNPTELPALVAEESNDRLGLLTYHDGVGGIEVVTLDSLVEDRGVGSALLTEARRRAQAANKRLWLITTNENLRAIGFYQRRGMEMVALHRNFCDMALRVRPDIEPASGRIVFQHAIEFEYPAPGAALRSDSSSGSSANP